MAGDTRIPKAELTGVYGALVKRMSRRMLGDMPEPVEVAWHNRKVLNFSFSLGRKARKWDRCDENLTSSAALADMTDDELRDPRAYLVRIVTRQALNRCGRWRGGARTTSGSGRSSRCSPAPTWPRTWSSPRPSRSRC